MTDQSPGADEIEAVARAIAVELRERRKLKYMGDCKCGTCQLVPLDLIDRAIIALDHLRTGRGLGAPSGRDARSDEYSRTMVVVLPNGKSVLLCDMFKVVFKEELMQIAGPIKGYSGADRRASQLIREAWNKLPVWPSCVGPIDEVEEQVRGIKRATPTPSTEEQPERSEDAAGKEL